ncbi:MAG: hypothetical protein HRT64_07420 [Erythrobacter sp.]|nr:hypothetical protein [Erythrobacter sp.]
MTDKTTFASLRKRYLARMAPRQVSPNARQFFVGVPTDKDMGEVGLYPATRVAVETEEFEACFKDALLVRDLVLERGKDAGQPMGMVTEAGLYWAKQNPADDAGKGD